MNSRYSNEFCNVYFLHRDTLRNTFPLFSALTALVSILWCFSNGFQAEVILRLHFIMPGSSPLSKSCQFSSTFLQDPAWQRHFHQLWVWDSSSLTPIWFTLTRHTWATASNKFAALPVSQGCVGFCVAPWIPSLTFEKFRSSFPLSQAKRKSCNQRWDVEQ